MRELKRANRLIDEKSPYLLQHAHNPVDWYPWGAEAFERAKAEDKPIFLSIGYSTCHWCHVMERECFEKEEAAEILNEHFISIKVDREERPDIDHIYMEACQALSGNGGWPLSVFIGHDKKPFFAGTYYPLRAFKGLLASIITLWTEKRSEIEKAKSEIYRYLEREASEEKREISEQTIHNAYLHLKSAFDRENGGFGRAPKFPSAHTLMYVRRYGIAYEEADAADMADYTLMRMYMGGLFDHIGGGFYRYSTDNEYLVPHFEKMLYDNAMLAMAYSEAGLFGIARQALEFCIRELQTDEGAFYTALDADSEGIEGKYYLFSLSEVEGLLGSNAERFCKMYDISRKGNYETQNILNLLKTGPLNREDEQFAKKCREILYRHRSTRIPPLRDEKVLLSSNSLMTAALATAGRMMHDEGYINAAVRTANFMLRKMRQDGRYYAVYNEGLQTHPATCDDYAYLAWALYRLHQATLDNRWLEMCKRLCEETIRLFGSENGLLYLSGTDVHDLPLRSLNTYDGALPSGNSIFAGVLLRLYTVTGEERWRYSLDEMMSALASDAAASPTAHTAFLSVVLCDKKGGIKVELPERLREVSEKFYPFVSFIGNSSRNEARICTRDACLTPVSDADELQRVIVMSTRER